MNRSTRPICRESRRLLYDARMLLRVIALSLVVLSACGGGLPDSSASPREGTELDARQWHSDVVRLEGDISRFEPGVADEGCCALAARLCALSARICDASRADENDEGTRVLCEDAEPRCTSSRARSRDACQCAPATSADD